VERRGAGAHGAGRSGCLNRQAYICLPPRRLDEPPIAEAQPRRAPSKSLVNALSEHPLPTSRSRAPLSPPISQLAALLPAPAALAPPRAARRRLAAARASALDGAPDFAPDPLPGGAQIFIFGTVHGEPDPRAAAFVLRRRPAAVVVETALTRAHGAAAGAVARRVECLAQTSAAGGGDPRALAAARLGVALEEDAAAAGGDPAAAPLWARVAASGALCAEQMAYAATFAVDAPLVHGDRPKPQTYARLAAVPSLGDLDAAFGARVALNYAAIAPRLVPPSEEELNKLAAHRILFEERDAALCASLAAAAAAAGPGAAVVGVVGEAHLAGMARLWPGGAWRGLAAAAAAPPPPREEPPAAAGARRAILEALLRLTAAEDVAGDVAAALGPVPPAARPAYELAEEMYGSARMLLAALDAAQLAEVCGGWRRPMGEALAPLRAARPLLGGAGFDEDVVRELRMLNYELRAPEA
jgi:hypothetical protein